MHKTTLDIRLFWFAQSSSAKMRSYLLLPTVFILAVSGRYQAIEEVSSPPQVTAAYSEGAAALKQAPKDDPRFYQHSVLSNGLQVVNVQDPKSTQVAMSVAVSAGSYYDPQAYLGLAHLTEHAMFLGSKNYAKQSGFDEFLASHGGGSNAYTAEETTVYYATLDASGFSEGMTRFGDVFADPLFNASWIWDEVSAVNSEHQKNKKSGQWRTQQILMSQASKISPVSTFHTGDFSTLKQETKENLAGNMSQYFDANYCPPRMRLVTFGPLSLDQQLQEAKKHFGSIPELGRAGKCSKTPETYASPKAWPSSSMKKFLRIKGLSTVPEMHLLFPTPSLDPWFKSHPLSYLQEVIGFDGKNSLTTVLRDDLNLASGVSVSAEDSSASSLVEVAFSLLPEGPKHVDTILDAFFNYLNKVRASSKEDKEKMMKSVAESSQLGFDWGDLPDPEKTVSGLSEQMLRMNAPDLLVADNLILEPVENITGKIEYILARMHPENMLVAMVDTEDDAYWSKTPDGVKNLSHYDALYTVQNLSDVFPSWKKWKGPRESHQLGAKLQMLQAVATVSSKSELPETVAKRFQEVTQASKVDSLKLFVPGEITDLPEPTMELAQATKGEVGLAKLWGEVPKKMLGCQEVPEKVEMWYRAGWMLPTPRITINLMLRRPEDPDPEANSAERALQLEIGLRMLGEQMSMSLALLKRTGVDWSFSAGQKSLALHLSSYASPTAAPAFQKVLAEIKKGLDPEEENGSGERRLKRIISDYKLELEDHTAAALKVAAGYRDVILTPGSHSKQEMLDLLNKSDLLAGKALAEAIDRRKEGNLSAVTMAMGALSKESAMELQVKVLHELGISKTEGKVKLADPDTAERVRRVLKPARPVELRAKNPRGDATNVMLMSILLGPADVKTRVLLNFVASVLEQVTFAELRTKLQLGYTVGGQVSTMSNVLTLTCFVQSEVSPPDEAEAHCEKTLALHMTEALEKMSDEAFNLTKGAFISSLMQSPMKISDEESHFWSPILLGKCLKLSEAMLQYAEKARKEDMVAAWKKAIFSTDVRKKVVVKLFGSGHEDQISAPSAEDVKHIWQKIEVPQPTLDLALREKNVTTELTGAAVSKHRDELRKSGAGIYEQTIACDVDAKDAESDEKTKHYDSNADPHKDEPPRGKKDADDTPSPPTFTVASNNVDGSSHPLPMQVTRLTEEDISARPLLRREVSPHDHSQVQDWEEENQYDEDE